MSSQDFSADSLRSNFLKFFEKEGHSIIAPASIIPENDPTSLFTTAGMQPLVPYLLGQNHPEGKRLANIQPCLRTDDIDEVGDRTHLTFFEMPGNWSLGGYWKEEAIKLSFEFLTEELGIDKESLAVSCFAGDEDAPKDEESAKIWKSLGIPESRIAFLGKKDNWWGPAGQTGPCGPDTEMFVWQGEGGAPDKFEGPDSDPNWVEVWNDVFMQYDKKEDGTFAPLSQKNVDTGLGFERVLAYLNDKSDIYQTELFWPIVEELQNLSGLIYKDDKESFRIIADHIRASVFVLAEGITPSNKLHGYVLRRLVRRAVTKSISLEIERDFTKELGKIVIAIYGKTYPKLSDKRKIILSELEKEEANFRRTLNQGMKMFEKTASESSKLTGQDLFDLYQTYGFPVELSLEISKEKNVPTEEGILDNFNKAMEEHQEKSRTASSGMFKGGLADNTEVTTRMHTATHLLLAALKQVLGDHVEQRGSNIKPERIRFDFSHPQKMTDEEKQEVEKIVNQKTQEAIPVEVEEMSLEKAREQGATGIFDDRYGNKVKVYTIGDFSKEICGGPHVENTSEIGKFKIKKEQSSSSGIRRIKATLE